MDSVTSSSVPLSHPPQYTHIGLNRIVALFGNTLIKTSEHIGPTIAAFSAIPMSIKAGTMLFLAIPVIWVAYLFFQGYQLLKEQDKLSIYLVTQETLKQIKSNFDKFDYNKLINKSISISELQTHYAELRDELDKYKQQLVPYMHLPFCNVFQERWKQFPENYLDNAEEEHLDSSKADIVTFTNNLKLAFDKVVDEQFPQHIEGFKKKVFL